jgi:CSLREA domain-containing protein
MGASPIDAFGGVSMAVWKIARGERAESQRIAGGGRSWAVVFAAFGALLWLLVTPTPAEAAAFIVTKVADTGGPCNPGNCSLRAAIGAANANAAPPHVIQFSNPMADCATGPCTITLASPMTTIVRSMVILDGSSAPGDRIVISGNNQAVAASGLTVVANNVTISSVWVYGFGGPGIAIVGNDNLVVNSWVGNLSGTVSPNSGDGIFVADSLRTRIGGPAAGQRNVIAGNLLAGIKLLRATDTTIQGNYVGLQPNGSAAPPQIWACSSTRRRAR